MIAVQNGFKSRRGVVAEAGGDFEAVVDEISQDQELAEGMGVEFENVRSEPELPAGSDEPEHGEQ